MSKRITEYEAKTMFENDFPEWKLITFNGASKSCDVQHNCGNIVTYNTFSYINLFGPHCQDCESKYKQYIINNSNVMLEWDWAKNNELGYDPNVLTETSPIRVWWKCQFGHKWLSPISTRGSGVSGCPYCNNKKVLSGFNDLASQRPDIAKQWHPEKNEELTPDQVTCGSSKRVWWVCDNGHEWEATVSNRIKQSSGCPFCSGKKVLVGFNDLLTTHPNIAKTWNYEKNKELMPTDVTYGSMKNVWWLCEKGHEYMAHICSRTIMLSGCPTCFGERKTSFPEQAICFYLNKIAVVKNRKSVYGKEVDIFLPDLNCAIEYDGEYFHNNEKSKKRELNKDKVLNDHNVTIYRIKESSKNYVEDNIIYYKYNIDSSNIPWVIKTLVQLLKLQDIDVDIDRDRVYIYEQYIMLERENSLVNKFPDVAAEWNYKKNGVLMPDMVAPHSSKKVWWICNEGHEWQATINNRTRGSGCPECRKKQQ